MIIKLVMALGQFCSEKRGSYSQLGPLISAVKPLPFANALFEFPEGCQCGIARSNILSPELRGSTVFMSSFQVQVWEGFGTQRHYIL